MSHLRTIFAICAIALPAGLIAGCGGDDASSEDPQTVLDDTFSNDNTVSSGNLNLSASISAEGEQGGSFEGSLSGPFQGNPDDEAALPQLDWTVSASGEGGGQSIDFEGGLVISEDNAFVEYGGETYEIGTEQFAELKKQMEAQAGTVDAGSASESFQAGCEQALEQAGVTDTSGCDIDLSSWLTNLTNEGTEDVGGAESVHIHGDADIEQMLTDIGELAATVPGAASQGIDPAQLSALSSAIPEASIDVYSTVDDNQLSKLELNMAIDPSALGGGVVAVPVDSIDIGFSVEIGEINEEQTIEVPTDAKPLNDLFSAAGVDLGDPLDALGGGLPGGLGTGGLGGSGGGGGGGSADADAYLKCLEQASTPEEINACASEL